MKIFPLFSKKDTDTPKVTSESENEMPLLVGEEPVGTADEIKKTLEVPESEIAEDMIETGVMPDTQIKEEEDKIFLDTPEGGLEEEVIELDPEKGILRTKDLVKKYGKRTVANKVSIYVKQGEIVGLLGPNGAGKTTTFYMTTGLITANSGKIFLDNQDITGYPVYKRAQLGIGYLAQEASVFRKLTVENNIRAVLEMTKMTKEQQKEKLEELIEEFNLHKVRKNLGDQLSGGERRRTEIARCLAINPKFIMLDEPFAGVDPIAVEDIQSVVYKLKEKNIGILITDHNAPETLSITDRAYLLFEGRILFRGTSEELAENPIVREKYLGRNFIFRRKKFD